MLPIKFWLCILFNLLLICDCLSGYKFIYVDPATGIKNFRIYFCNFCVICYNFCNCFTHIFLSDLSDLFVSDIIIKHLIIYQLLVIGGVETHPGPALDPGPKPNLKIRTYNCNGLGNVNKFWRLLIKAWDEVTKGGIILLQETHIKDENLIKT